MSKEFKSRIVLGKNEYLYTVWAVSGQDQSDESALKVGPNHPCL